MSDERVYQEEHVAAVFWAVCSVMVGVFLLAAQPETRLSTIPGVAFLAAYTVLNLVYAVRIAIGPEWGDAERLLAASAVTAVLGVHQYLAGDLPVLAVLTPLFVLGAVAVLERRHRLAFLPVAVLTALSPLLYVSLDWRAIVEQVTLTVVLLAEMVLVGDYGDRLRRQRKQLAEAEADASERAIRDELTALHNRRALMMRIAPTAPARTESATVVYCDLDGFKPVNDRFGHAAGDALLGRLGRALTAAVDGHGVAYRVGGDEFCVLLDGHEAADGPLVTSLVASLCETGAGYDVRCSYGVAQAPDDAADLAGALRVADQRMYLVKAGRRAGDPRPDPPGIGPS